MASAAVHPAGGEVPVILTFAALLAAAQADEPPAEVVQAEQAFSSCITGRLDQAEGNVRPETIADAILAHSPQVSPS